MATQIAISAQKQIINADHDNPVTMPGVGEIGQEYFIYDNLGMASASNVLTINGPLDNGGTSSTIATAFGTLRLTWMGAAYATG